MWLEVDFGDMSFEEAVVYYIYRHLSHYTPFRSATPQFCAICKQDYTKGRLLWQ